jgi:hypothetical protein
LSHQPRNGRINYPRWRFDKPKSCRLFDERVVVGRREIPGVHVLTTPDVFVGVVLWAVNSGVLSDAQRTKFFRRATQAMPQLAEATARLYPSWTSLTVAWQQKHKSLTDLWRIGMLG